MALRITNISLSSLLKRPADARLTQGRIQAATKHDTVDTRLSWGIVDYLDPQVNYPSNLMITKALGSSLTLASDNPSILELTKGVVLALCTDPGPPPPSTDLMRVTSEYALTAVGPPPEGDFQGQQRVTGTYMLTAFKQIIAIPKRMTSQYSVFANLALPKQNVTMQQLLVAVHQGSLRISQARVQVARRRFKVLDSEVTNVAFMLTIERKDGVFKRFTALDRDLEWEGDVYRSCNSFTPTSIDSSTDMSVDNLDMQGVLDTDDIDENDLLVGLYNDAKVTLFIVDWVTLGPERYILRTGTIGKITQMKQQFHAEVRGLLQQAQEAYGGVYKPTCDTSLGTSLCKLNLGDFTFTGVVVTTVTNNRLFVASGLAQDTGYFSYGTVQFETGANAGLKQEIKGFTAGGAVEMWEEFPYDVETGDTFTIVAGCDRKFTTCKDRFNNAVNFRGHKDVPGNDSISQYPDAKQ